jgi:outer membrane protein
LNKAKFDYQNVIGELNENLIKPEIYEEKFDKNKILESALNNNHNIKSYHYKYLASKSAYNAEKSNFLPKVSIVASASKQDKVVYLNNQDLNSQSVFLNVSVPIFQKGMEYANVSKAGYERDSAKEELEITRENIIKEINQALEEYHFYLEMNKTNQKLFEMAKDRSRIFNKRSESQVEDPIEVIRARIEANDRKINYIDSQMDLVITYYKIKYFLGEI